MRSEPGRAENPATKTGEFPVVQEAKFGPRIEGMLIDLEVLVRKKEDPAKMNKLMREYAKLVLDEAENEGKLPVGSVEWLFSKGEDPRRDQVRERIMKHVAKEFDDLGKPHRPSMREVTKYFLNYAIPSISSPFEMARKLAALEKGKKAA